MFYTYACLQAMRFRDIMRTFRQLTCRQKMRACFIARTRFDGRANLSASGAASLIVTAPVTLFFPVPSEAVGGSNGFAAMGVCIIFIDRARGYAVTSSRAGGGSEGSAEKPFSRAM